MVTLIDGTWLTALGNHYCFPTFIILTALGLFPPRSPAGETSSGSWSPDEQFKIKSSTMATAAIHRYGTEETQKAIAELTKPNVSQEALQHLKKKKQQEKGILYQMHKTVTQSFIIIVKYYVHSWGVCNRFTTNMWVMLSAAILQSLWDHWVPRIFQLQANLWDHRMHGLSLTGVSMWGLIYFYNQSPPLPIANYEREESVLDFFSREIF